MNQRVVITGLGAVSPLGPTVSDLWEGIRNAQCGIGPITAFDTSDYKTKLSA